MCTTTHHDHIVATAWGSLLNARPWPDADLEIAECPECKSTLAREVNKQLSEQGLVSNSTAHQRKEI